MAERGVASVEGTEIKAVLDGHSTVEETTIFIDGDEFRVLNIVEATDEIKNGVKMSEDKENVKGMKDDIKDKSEGSDLENIDELSEKDTEIKGDVNEGLDVEPKEELGQNGEDVNETKEEIENIDNVDNEQKLDEHDMVSNGDELITQTRQESKGQIHNENVVLSEEHSRTTNTLGKDNDTMKTSGTTNVRIVPLRTVANVSFTKSYDDFVLRHFVKSFTTY